MKIGELKEGQRIVRCIDNEHRSTYAPAVKRTEMVVVKNDGGEVEVVGGGVTKIDLSSGRWYALVPREWTPAEASELVGNKVTSDGSTLLVTSYESKGDFIMLGSQICERNRIHEYFGDKYDEVRLEE